MKPLLIVVALLSVLLMRAEAQWTTQTIPLSPGWNAVFLEVHPQPSDADIVFAGLPVESVWEWNRNAAAVDFIQDPAKLVPRLPQWATWFPEASPNRFVANLFEIRGGRALLIKVAGSSSTTWTVQGTPARPEASWAADGFSLAGFHIKSGTTLTFASYFAASAAHTGQQTYQMSPSGVWQLVPQTTVIQRGKAYWVRTKGVSTYLGPVDVALERAAGIDYGTLLEQSEVVLNNRGAASETVTLALGASGPRPAGIDTVGPVAGPVLLYYRDFAKAGAVSGLPDWLPFTGTLSYTLPVGGSKTLQFATRRAELAAPAAGSGNPATYQGIIEVGTNSGQRQAIPVTVQQALASTGTALRNGPPAVHRYAGLWVGSASLDRVNWLGGVSPNVAAANPAFNGTDRLTPRKTASEFPMRLIIHVDQNGQARVLQKVIQVWENGTVIPDPGNPGLVLPATSGRYRLFTTDQGASAFANPASGSGATLRNGVSVPRRISTIFFPVRTPLAMTGSFGTGNLDAILTIGYNDPLNPFKHTFHPQHDNKNATFDATLPPNVESYSVVRAVRLEFSAVPPNNFKTPGWGDTELGGTYKETITGLHRDPINVAGPLLLRRVSANPTLD